jgi:caa(3)-type oxidase subunit IV
MALIGLLFFMGLIRESTLLRLAAAGGLFWLIAMFVLTFSDYFTRRI